MRRFEFVEGTSAKFWAASVEGATFVVLYGRLGTAGQRKDKAFPDEKAAQKEYEKKIAEKLREGYHEVAPDAAAAAPPAAKGAAAAAPKLALPPRVGAGTASPERIETAVAALKALDSALGKRSWAVAQRARKARRALEALGGYDPAKSPALASAFDALMARVAVPARGPRLSLRVAMELLHELDVAAFERALETWRKAPAGAPTVSAVGVIAKQLDALESPELALRVGALLADRPASEAGWSKRWQSLSRHLDAHLTAKGTKLRDYVKSIDKSADASIARRVARM